VQATWNLLEVSAADSLAEAHDRGWGVILKEVLANGRLTGRAPEAHVGPLSEVARELASTCDQVAIAAALNQSWADVVLSGAVTANQALSNLNAANLTLSTGHMNRLRKLVEAPVDYWAKRASRRWQ
jgi:aryl-alcohol dehydrogenase-like predicted oxidoreductase